MGDDDDDDDDDDVDDDDDDDDADEEDAEEEPRRHRRRRQRCHWVRRSTAWLPSLRAAPAAARAAAPLPAGTARRLRGLLNRLSEPTIDGVSADLAGLYSEGRAAAQPRARRGDARGVRV